MKNINWLHTCEFDILLYHETVLNLKGGRLLYFSFKPLELTMSCKNTSLNGNIKLYGHGIFNIPYACSLNDKTFFIPASPHINKEYNFEIDAKMTKIDLNISQGILGHIKKLELGNNHFKYNLYKKILTHLNQVPKEHSPTKSPTQIAAWSLSTLTMVAILSALGAWALRHQMRKTSEPQNHVEEQSMSNLDQSTSNLDQEAKME